MNGDIQVKRTTGIRRKFLNCLFPTMTMNFLIYGLNSIFVSYMPLYLGKFFSPTEKGLLLSLGSIVMLFSTFWGVISDKARYKNTVLASTIVLSAVAFCLVTLSSNFFYVAAIIVVIMIFMSSFSGLVDNMTLEISTEKSCNYGIMRVMGTVGYGMVVLVTSFFSDMDIDLIFFVYIGVALLAAFFVMASPKVKGHASQGKIKKVSALPMFRDKNLVIMMAVCCIVTLCFVYYQNYMPNYITDTLNMPHSIWGINVLLTVVLEIPFFIFFDFIMKKVNMKWMIVFCIVINVLRYVLLGTVTSAVGILIIGSVTGAWVTVLTYCCCYYIDRTVNDEVRASGMTLLYAVISGIPKTVAGFGGGILTEAFGFKISILFAAVLCAIMVIPALALPSDMLKKEKNSFDEIENKNK